ncbi:MAG: tRNA lysidine(34) synthetase TilS [Blastocatellia bacterium]
MHKFVRNLITEWRRLGLPFSGVTAVIAVSGGADSVSLLLALHDLKRRKKLDIRFVVAHFDHKLRGRESGKDARFVEKFAERLGFDFVLGSGKIKRTGNLEQNARNGRYEFLKQTAKENKAFAVLTGHTKNDQAETFLMNLIRGSGIDGLAGMTPVRKLDEEKRRSEEKEPAIRNLQSTILLARPLLQWAKRSDTEAFCRGCGVVFRNDSMNEDTAFKRVKVRKELIPILHEYNPKIIETLARTAELLQQNSEPVVAATGLNADDQLLEDQKILKLKELIELAKPSLYHTLRKWLRVNRGNLRSIQLKHIEAIERLIHSRKSGKIVELPGGQTVSKGGGRLVLTEIRVDK